MVIFLIRIKRMRNLIKSRMSIRNLYRNIYSLRRRRRKKKKKVKNDNPIPNSNIFIII